MDEYIRKEDAINCIEHMTWYHVNGRGQLVDGANSDTGLYKAKDVYKGLHDIPAADAVPVIHGYWKSYSGRRVEISEEGCPLGECFCSVCGDWLVASDEYYVKGRFCPNCGTKMDGCKTPEICEESVDEEESTDD